MYRHDRSYSPWWTRFRILSSVMAALCFCVFFTLSCLKMDGHSAVGRWSWLHITIAPLSTMLVCIIIYCAIHYYTRHAAFTYTSDAAASYLLGIRTKDLDSYHQIWVFRDILLSFGYLVLCLLGLFLALQTCQSCNTPYSLVSIGAALIYFLRILHTVYLQLDGYKRIRLMIYEVGKFQEFLDQQRLFQFVLPDLYSKNKDTQKWLACFLWLSLVILAILGSIWIGNKNCQMSCPGTFLNTKYLLYGIYGLEFFWLLSEFYLIYLQRLSGLENIEGLIDRIENEHQQDKKRHFQLLQAERQKRQNDSTSTR